MSWWDTTGFKGFATSALLNAQKKIDKVLDIQGGENDESNNEQATVTASSSSSSLSAPRSHLPSQTQSQSTEKTTDDDTFWSHWFDGTNEAQTVTSSQLPKTSSERSISSSRNSSSSSISSLDKTTLSPTKSSKFTKGKTRVKLGRRERNTESNSDNKNQVHAEKTIANKDSEENKTARPLNLDLKRIQVTTKITENAHSAVDVNKQDENRTKQASMSHEEGKIDLAVHDSDNLETMKKVHQYGEEIQQTDVGGSVPLTEQTHVGTYVTKCKTPDFNEIPNEIGSACDLQLNVQLDTSNVCTESYVITYGSSSDLLTGTGVSNKEAEDQVKFIDTYTVQEQTNAVDVEHTPLNISGDGGVSGESETTLCGSFDKEELDSSTESVNLQQVKSEKSITSSASSVSSESYVKCSVEETKQEDNESHSSFSELIKLNSGHTSGDEIDTTTSSDIEIISNPTPSSNNGDKPFDLSPLHHALKRSMKNPNTHKRSDSSDSSGPGRFSDLEQLSPGSSNGDVDQGKSISKLGMSEELNVQISESTGGLHQDKLLKKLAEMAEILDAREHRLVQQSKENMDLQECNSILRSQLEQAEANHTAEMTDLNSLTEEFTQRIAENERKLQLAAKDRETMKKQLQSAQEEVTKRSSSSSATQKMLKEKDEQIAELMTEGEKLSKQQLQSNNIIKKLRAKEKDNEAVINTQKEKLETQKVEIEHLKTVLDSKDSMERKQRDAISQLNAAVKQQEKEILRLKSDSEDSQEKTRSMQVALDSAYKEISELNKKNATRNSEAQEAALSAEMHAKEEIRLTLEKIRLQSINEKEAMVLQIEDLHLSLNRMEKEHGRREDILRQEISDLQQRLQEADDRNDVLTQNVSAATRPLLRQIENLQSTYAAQSSSFEKVEKNITERLADAQTQLALATEKERAISEELMEVRPKLTTLESQNSSLRQEKSRLMAQLQMEKTKLEKLEDTRHSENVQLENTKANYFQELSNFKKEKVLLENELEMERMKVETEKKKLALAHEQLKEKEVQIARAQSPSLRMTMSMPATGNRRDSSGSEHSVPLINVSQDEMLERTLMLSSANGTKTNLYETLRQTGAAALVEGLESQLKQKEGEIVQLQSDISELEGTRESMARELVNMQTKIDMMEVELTELPLYKQKLSELEQRYDALLQMYGEKVEETEELRLDLQDVKDMYKQQIEELVQRTH